MNTTLRSVSCVDTSITRGVAVEWGHMRTGPTGAAVAGLALKMNERGRQGTPKGKATLRGIYGTGHVRIIPVIRAISRTFALCDSMHRQALGLPFL